MFRLLVVAALTVIVSSCNQQKPIFQKVSSSQSGINFNNAIKETDSVNVLDFENVYNGGGVGVGDFNNDGLQDLYFAGNQVSNKLYLNKGEFKFNDVTQAAGVLGKNRWAKGVSIVDINNDGLEDIYISASIKKNGVDRRNVLYINRGSNEQGIPKFEDQAAEYGLSDTTFSTMASFFDSDNDGDLDCYIVVNDIVDGDFPNRFRPRMLNGEHPSTGRLYKNDWDPVKKHGYFTDVSKQAGMLIEGYGHNASISDINRDGWKDIYVTNDYLSNNILYVNNKNGTFTDKVTTYFKHTSANAMGSDIIDINNDGLSDVIELDMSPQDNFRKKMMTNGNIYQTYQNTEYFKYQYQYVRNMFQINRGPRLLQQDSIGDPIFSDISFMAGVAETDWSWSPVVTDFNNDGFRDLVVTNGFPKDVTDHDFIAFRNDAYSLSSKKEILSQIPEVKIPNYAFLNNGNLTFKNVSADWGLTDASFSNGAAYADLDNDGAMDLITNNINDEAFIYRNTSRDNSPEENHYLQVKLIGSQNNINAIGSWIEIFYDKGKMQSYENIPYRGYLSTNQNVAHFGLGNTNTIDSIVVSWTTGTKQVIKGVKVDQILKVDVKNSKLFASAAYPKFASKNLFTEVTSALNINYIQQENDFIDFNVQKLLPHKFSEYGPALAVGDVNGDGLDDFISGGAFSFSPQVFSQNTDGTFKQTSLIPDADIFNKRWEDLGILLFDADADGDLDLYTASGSYENERNTNVYQDKLFVNDGKGKFLLDSSALPQNFTSKFCVRAIDFDKDSDLDLFVSARVDPWNYPKPVSSRILRNESKNGKIKFTDATSLVAKDLQNIGLVCDASFTDFDNDGWQDLMLAGEWMPITFLKNTKGIFNSIALKSNIADKLGWWNTIAPGDFDNDGDTDYIVGNLGKNSFYKASEAYPAYITSSDFDKNGNYDAIPSLYLPDRNGDMKEFPAQTRDDMIKQLISTRIKFQNYRSYALATMEDILSPEQRKGAMRLKANCFVSSYIENLGGGKFAMHDLPIEAQVSALNGISVEDYTGDGNLDVVINGNDFGTEVSVGRYDALNGLLLRGNGAGQFTPLSILESGIFIPGNGKALVKVRGIKSKSILIASQNKGAIKAFRFRNNDTLIPLLKDDVSAIIKLRNGKMRKEEIYYGSSFLSQSGRFLNINASVLDVEVTNTKGQRRKLAIK